MAASATSPPTVPPAMAPLLDECAFGLDVGFEVEEVVVKELVLCLAKREMSMMALSWQLVSEFRC